MTRDRLVAFLLLAAVWAVAAHAQLVSPLFLPKPELVAQKAMQMTASGELGSAVGATLLRVLAGFGIGAAIGLVGGLILGFSGRVYSAAAPFVDFGRSVPVTAILPLFLLGFGIGAAAKIAAIAWASALMVLINTALGVRSISAVRLTVARVMRAGPVHRLLFFALPDALPHITIGLRTAVSFAVVVGIVTEMLLTTDNGVGALIYRASIMYRTEEVYVGIVCAGGLGYGLNAVMAFLDNRVVHWRGR